MHQFFDGHQVDRPQPYAQDIPTTQERKVYINHIAELHRRNDLLQAALDKSIAREAARQTKEMG